MSPSCIIKGAGALVENQNRGISQPCPSNSNPLFLATAQSISLGCDNSVQFLWKILNYSSQHGNIDTFLNVPFCDPFVFRATKYDIPEYGLVEKRVLLVENCDVISNPIRIKCFHRISVYRDFSGHWSIDSCKQRSERRFAGSNRPNNECHFSSREEET